MKKIKLYTLLILLLLLSNYASSQFIDNYGLKVGVGISNQHFTYNRFAINETGWKEDKIGFSLLINAEKHINRFLTIRPEIGYTQKGFRENQEYILPAPFQSYTIDNYRATLHNLSINLGSKIYPFKSKEKPYLIAGLRSDYLIGYKDSPIIIDNNPSDLYDRYFDRFKNFVFSGIIGIGMQFNDLIFMEFEYNPAFNRSFKSGTQIKERLFSISLGLNIPKVKKSN